MEIMDTDITPMIVTIFYIYSAPYMYVCMYVCITVTFLCLLLIQCRLLNRSSN